MCAGKMYPTWANSALQVTDALGQVSQCKFVDKSSIIDKSLVRMSSEVDKSSPVDKIKRSLVS